MPPQLPQQLPQQQFPHGQFQHQLHLLQQRQQWEWQAQLQALHARALFTEVQRAAWQAHAEYQ